jgi:hypothetical protein
LCSEIEWNLANSQAIKVVWGASKIKLKKNKKRMVTVRRVIIFLNILKHPSLIWLHCCLQAMAMATAAMVVLTPLFKNLKKGFLGIFNGLPLV